MVESLKGNWQEKSRPNHEKRCLSSSFVSSGNYGQERKETKQTKRRLVPSNARKIAIFLISSVMQCLCVGLTYGYSILYVEVIRALQTNRKEASLVQSLVTCLMFGGGIFWPGLVRKIGPGLCIIIGSTLTAAALVSSAFAENIIFLIITAGALAGIGLSICYVCTFIIIAWTFDEGRGLALTSSTIGSSIGQFIIPYILEVSVQTYTWRGGYILLGGLLLQGVVCGVGAFTSRHYFYNRPEDAEEHSGRCTAVDFSLLKDFVFVAILFCVFLIDLAGAQAYFIVDLAEIRNYSRTLGSNLVFVMGITNFAGRILAVSVRKICTRLQTYLHWTYTGLLMGASYALLYLCQDYPSLIVAAALFGTGFGSFMGQAPAVVFEATGLAKYPNAVGYLNFAYGTGAFAGTFISSTMKDAMGDYNMTLLLFTILSVLPTVNCVVIFVYKTCTQSASKQDNNKNQMDYVRMEEG